MKNIYIINERSNAAIYGIGTFLREYIECLKKMGARINVIELNSTKKEFQIREKDGLTVYLFPYQYSSNKDKYLSNLIHLCRLYIKDSNNMVFHINYSNSEYFVKLLREYYPLSKIIHTIHYQDWTWMLSGNKELYNKIINKMKTKSVQKKYAVIIDNYIKEKLIYDQIDKLICLSKDTYDIVKNIYQQDESKISLVPNGLKEKKREKKKRSLLEIRKKHFIEENTKVLLYVGRLDKLKGVDSLILSFINLIKLYPNCRLVIVGAGGDFLRPLKLANNVACKITFTGLLSHKELKQWYQIADIGIIPSYAEQCSYVGIEMMMYSLPIIVSNGIGIRNMFTDGINGKIVSIDNRNNAKIFQTNLYNAIIELLASPKLCEKLSYGARKAYENYYRQENMRMGYKKVFDSIDNIL